MLSNEEIQKIRARFPVFRHKIYLNSCSQGALSDAVEQGFHAYMCSWHAEGSPWDLWIERYEEARRTFAHMIGAKAEEVAITTSASAAVNSLASVFNFARRKKVVLGEFEFPTMGHIWLAQRHRGAQVQFLEATGDTLPAESYERAMDAQTFIVPLTHVSFLNGFRLEVQRIARCAHAHGALVLLDDYQDCGTRPVNVKTLGVDFYVSGTLKYLLSAAGLAFLYVREDLIESMTPTISGWFAQSNPFAFDVKRFDLAGTARRFQTGTPAIPSIYAALPALALLSEIGLEKVSAQIEKLSRFLVEGIRALGIRIKTPADTIGPLIVLQARDANAVVAKLAEEGIVTSSRHDGVRISLHVYNTLEDIRAVLAILERHLDLLVRVSKPG